MKNSKRNIIIYFLEMLLVFLIIDFLATIIASGVGQSSLFYKYGDDLIIEVFYAFTTLIVMLLFKNSYVFTEKKENFWSGILLAIPILLISLINFIYSILNIGTFNLASFINMLVFCTFIGIAEEFLCRGWIQNEFLERFSGNKKKIIISILLSSFIFGFMHLVNVNVQTLFETIIQIINATALGFLLGSIYYKTKNIWTVIFLHGFYDFAIMLGEIDMIKDCSYNNPTLIFGIYESFGVLLISAFWVLGAIYVLNKCDFNKKNSKKHSNDLLFISMGFIFILILIPFGRFIPNYDSYRVCYKYSEIDEFNEYTIHYPNKEKFIIEHTKNDFSYKNELVAIDYRLMLYKNSKGKVVIKNLNTLNERELEYTNVIKYEMFESKNKFNIAILTSENESTLYVSEDIVKNSMNDKLSFVNNIKFNKYVLPKITTLGYIDNYDNVYAYAVSKNNDKFVVMEGKLFVIN